MPGMAAQEEGGKKAEPSSLLEALAGLVAELHNFQPETCKAGGASVSQLCGGKLRHVV